jgi:hypothetical protein
MLTQTNSGLLRNWSNTKARLFAGAPSCHASLQILAIAGLSLWFVCGRRGLA